MDVARPTLVFGACRKRCFDHAIVLEEFKLKTGWIFPPTHETGVGIWLLLHLLLVQTFLNLGFKRNLGGR